VLDVADHVLRGSIDLPAPRAVSFTAGPLQGPARERVERAFRAPVFDQYGCAEVPWIAGECPAYAGLHVNSDERLVEILDEQGRPVPAGTVGEVVITDLSNRAVPLVRYRLGDRAALLEGECPCGVTLPLMTPVEGRSDDLVRLVDGRTVAPTWFRSWLALGDAPVRQYRVEQHADSSISLVIVPREGADAVHRLEQLRAAMAEEIGAGAQLRLELVDSIPHDRGKTRDVVSDYAPVSP
jgi:phenylacetate-CoA ligase